MGISIKIQSPSDREKDHRLRLMWGDYWVKEELGRALTALGMMRDERDPQVVLQLFGSPPKKPLPADTLNLVWLYSHPDRVTPDNLRCYHRIFCASKGFAERLSGMGYESVEYMPACTAKQPVKRPVVYPVVFLGNARSSRPDGRKIIRDILDTGHPFKAWGNLWDRLLPEACYGGQYWAYERLEDLYASAGITLNDHHVDMAREGFVSNKVFDILASGGFCISSPNRGLNLLFGDAVPQYESVDHLKELLAYYSNHEEERQRLMTSGRRAALSHTYQARAVRLAEYIREQV